MKKSSAARRPDARVTKSRRALRTALVDLVATMPFEAVTVAAITTQAGIGYATFFRHYPGRDALLTEIADEIIGDLLGLVAPLALSGDTAAASLTLTRFVESRRGICRALLVGAGDAMRRDITARAIAVAGGTTGATPEWLPRDLGIVHSVAAILTILAWWLEHDAARSAADVAILVERLVLQPMASGH